MIKAISSTALRSSLMASGLLILIIMMNETVGVYIVLIAFISFIITFFIALFMIIATVVPLILYGLLIQHSTIETVFKQFFPYYALFSFGFCVYLSLSDDEAYYIFVPAFFTSIMAWLWLFKSLLNTNYENKY